MSSPAEPPVFMIPAHLAEAIEWVLKGKKESAPDLSRLTSQQMQLLPLPVAQAFMELTLAVMQGQPTTVPSHEVWVDARAAQRARRNRQRASSLTAAQQRLHAWYIQTANAQRRRATK